MAADAVFLDTNGWLALLSATDSLHSADALRDATVIMPMTRVLALRCSPLTKGRRLVAAMAALTLWVGAAAGLGAVIAGKGGAPETSAAVLEGTVRDSAGVPVAGATVQIRSARTAPWYRGTTDAQGRDRVEGIEPGRYLIWVELGNFISTHDEVITVAAGVNRQDLPCPRREIRGRVLSPEGRPVAGAMVTLHRNGGSETTRVQATRPEGTFSFVVQDGWYSLFADAPGFPQFSRDTPLRVHGASRTEEVRLRRDAPVKSRGAAIRGRVTGLSAAELAEARVSAYPPGGGLPLDARVDAAGRYRIADVELAGDWGLLVEAASKKIQGMVKIPPGPAGREVNEVDLAFPEYFAVSGRVRNADGSPSDFDLVSFDDPRQAGSHSTGIGPQGSFSIALPSGTYKIAAAPLSDRVVNIGALAQAPVVVDGKPRQNVEIHLDATGIIAGRLLGGAAEDRMQDMTVRAFQGHLSQDGKVDDRGHYEIAGLVPGLWQVMAWSGNGDIASAKVSLPEDIPRASLDLSFRPGPLALSGRLVGFDPEAQYLLKLERADDRYDSHLISVEHDGSFSRSGLVAGTYHLKVTDSRMAWPLYTGTVDLQSDRHLDLELTFPP
jgi:hypothetical protein